MGFSEIVREFVIFLLTVATLPTSGYSQEFYDDCNSPLEICSNESYSVNNIGASVSVCPGCADDFNFCFTLENSIWLSFTTNNSGGDASIDFSNLVFESNAGQDTELQAVIIEAPVPCNSGTYNQVGDCASNETGDFTLNALGLNPNSTYYVVVDGDQTGAGITDPAECTFDVIVSGTGVDRPVPDLTLAQSTSNPCMNEVVTYTATPFSCPVSSDYYWYVNDTLAAVTSDSIFQISDLQTGDVVSVQTTCYTQCVDTLRINSVPVNVYSFPLDAGEDVEILQGESIQLNGSTTGSNILWTPGFYLSADNILNPIAVPDETTTFTLAAEQNGCTQYDYITVTVNAGLIIPNTFSPNGDDINDTWVILGIENYPNNQVEIYTRWGQKIFQSSSYSELKAWDGNSGSSTVSESVYYYIIDLRDGSEEIKGYLNVIR